MTQELTDYLAKIALSQTETIKAQVGAKLASTDRIDNVLIGWCIGCFLILTVPPFRYMLQTPLRVGNAVQTSIIEPLTSPEQLDPIEPFVPEFSATPELGYEVAGYKVTSVYGDREKPCETCSDNHKGVDLGTPVGTPLFSIGDTSVTCESDPTGWGLYALSVSEKFERTFLYAHLSDCKDGSYKDGERFARTGGAEGDENSGSSTGAHLHFEERLKTTPENPLGEPTAPASGWVWWTVLGHEPKPLFSRWKKP